MTNAEKATCPVCGTQIEEGDSKTVCPACKVVFHEECWQENKGCSTYGCKLVSVMNPPVRIDVPRAVRVDVSQDAPSAIASSSNIVNVLNKPWCYLAIAGLIFGFGGWVVAEIFCPERNYIFNTFLLTAACVFIGFGISSAEQFMNGNYMSALVRGFLAAGIGLLCGPVAFYYAGGVGNVLFFYFGGGQGRMYVDIIAIALAWSFAGCFVAIAPGILMWSSKKIELGIKGGFVGGLLGGILFYPVFMITQTYFLPRLVVVVSLGVFAGLAIGLLEEAAKQGWLKVTAGLLAGKQFIIYKNPTIIGSSPKCEIYLFKDAAVKPSHAAIRIQEKSFVIEALDGTGAVYVNGQPVSERKLRNGDSISIGSTQFVFGTKDI